MTGMRALAAAALLALSAPAVAQEKPAAAAPPPKRDIEECRQLKDQPGELECYRGLSSRPRRPGYIVTSQPDRGWRRSI